MKLKRDQIIEEYRRRDTDPTLQARYTLLNPGTLFILQSLERRLIQTMKRHNLLPFRNQRVLDFGCGEGGMLSFFIQLGAAPSKLYGCDLLEHRVAKARPKLPEGVSLVAADGCSLPFADNAFGLVYVSMVFSSVPDPDMRQEIAKELWRVVEPGGSILWYDFHIARPGNKTIRAISPKEVQSLFPTSLSFFERLTLLPPISQRLVPVSRIAASILEIIPWLRSHHIGVLKKLEK
ncbi:MAG: class I SAM-dependent methyltransferase [Bdellovibrionales bacterium]|nr:class I SAM-dependent methyltransferase [Bdellovibrionales bacterium]